MLLLEQLLSEEECEARQICRKPEETGEKEVRLMAALVAMAGHRD